MARSSNKTKKWNIYSTHYSPANSSSTSNQTASSDQNELAPSRRSSSEYLPYGRQRSVFPYGIVNEYDLKNPRIGAETSDRIFPEKLDSIAAKWRSSPCLESSSTAPRWGTKILQTSCRSPSSEDGDSIGGIKPRSRSGFRKRMHSCPSTPVNDFLRVEVPRLSSIMVQAQSLPLVSRPLQPVMPTKPLKQAPASTETRRQRAASLNSFERPKKTSSESEIRSMEKEVSKSLSEIKIEDGIIIIDNGKAIDLRKDKLGKKHKLKHTEAAKTRSYREFQDEMQKFEDAQMNLEGEFKAKAKTLETKDKEQDFFNEHVQTQFLDLLSSVKEKRKKTKGKKYRC